jgi:hypothetical protein
VLGDKVDLGTIRERRKDKKMTTVVFWFVSLLKITFIGVFTFCIILFMIPEKHERWWRKTKRVLWMTPSIAMLCAWTFIGITSSSPVASEEATWGLLAFVFFGIPTSMVFAGTMAILEASGKWKV